MKLIEKDEKVILVDDEGNVVSPNDPIAVDYIIDRYNACVKDKQKIEDDLKNVGITSIDQLNNVTDPDADYINLLNQGSRMKPRFYSPMLHMIKDNYISVRSQSDLISKYISENNIDYGTIDENGFIVKKDQER